MSNHTEATKLLRAGDTEAAQVRALLAVADAIDHLSANLTAEQVKTQTILDEIKNKLGGLR